MGRLADDMTRLVGEIQAARDDRRRLMRDLKHATVEMRRAVAHLRSSFAADLAGARAAWLGAPASVSPTEQRLKAKRDAEELAKRDAEVRAKQDAEERAKRDAEVRAKRRVRKAKRPARDKARTVHKAGGRHRSR